MATELAKLRLAIIIYEKNFILIHSVQEVEYLIKPEKIKHPDESVSMINAMLLKEFALLS